MGTTIKGQNLRLFRNINPSQGVAGHRCFAAALSCDLNIDVQTEEVTTCDSDGDWARYDVTGKKWGANTECAMMDGVKEAHSFINKTTYNLHLETGESLLIWAPVTQLISITGNVTTKSSSSGLLVTTAISATDVTISLNATGKADETVIVLLMDHSEDQLIYLRIISDVLNGAKFQIAMDITSGAKNRVIDECVFEGEAWATSFRVNSTNRQRPTFAIGFTGTGAPFDQNAPAAASLSLDDEEGEPIPEF